ncbi:unnamed protein product [Amoebophrya sp. A120]|nr:unnamed protein product [Amoebophrya sp. A120]|eukprot:GSA120T00009739001.1
MAPQIKTSVREDQEVQDGRFAPSPRVVQRERLVPAKKTERREDRPPNRAVPVASVKNDGTTTIAKANSKAIVRPVVGTAARAEENERMDHMKLPAQLLNSPRSILRAWEKMIFGNVYVNKNVSQESHSHTSQQQQHGRHEEACQVDQDVNVADTTDHAINEPVGGAQQQPEIIQDFVHEAFATTTTESCRVDEDQDVTNKKGKLEIKLRPREGAGKAKVELQRDKVEQVAAPPQEEQHHFYNFHWTTTRRPKTAPTSAEQHGGTVRNRETTATSPASAQNKQVAGGVVDVELYTLAPPLPDSTTDAPPAKRVVVSTHDQLASNSDRLVAAPSTRHGPPHGSPVNFRPHHPEPHSSFPTVKTMLPQQPRGTSTTLGVAGAGGSRNMKRSSASGVQLGRSADRSLMWSTTTQNYGCTHDQPHDIAAQDREEQVFFLHLAKQLNLLSATDSLELKKLLSILHDKSTEQLLAGVEIPENWKHTRIEEETVSTKMKRLSRIEEMETFKSQHETENSGGFFGIRENLLLLVASRDKNNFHAERTTKPSKTVTITESTFRRERRLHAEKRKQDLEKLLQQMKKQLHEHTLHSKQILQRFLKDYDFREDVVALEMQMGYNSSANSWNKGKNFHVYNLIRQRLNNNLGTNKAVIRDRIYVVYHDTTSRRSLLQHIIGPQTCSTEVGAHHLLQEEDLLEQEKELLAEKSRTEHDEEAFLKVLERYLNAFFPNVKFGFVKYHSRSRRMIGGGAGCGPRVSDASSSAGQQEAIAINHHGPAPAPAPHKHHSLDLGTFQQAYQDAMGVVELLVVGDEEESKQETPHEKDNTRSIDLYLTQQDKFLVQRSSVDSLQTHITPRIAFHAQPVAKQTRSRTTGSSAARKKESSKTAAPPPFAPHLRTNSGLSLGRVVLSSSLERASKGKRTTGARRSAIMTPGRSRMVEHQVQFSTLTPLIEAVEEELYAKEAIDVRSSVLAKASTINKIPGGRLRHFRKQLLEKKGNLLMQVRFEEEKEKRLRSKLASWVLDLIVVEITRVICESCFGIEHSDCEEKDSQRHPLGHLQPQVEHGVSPAGSRKFPRYDCLLRREQDESGKQLQRSSGTPLSSQSHNSHTQERTTTHLDLCPSCLTKLYFAIGTTATASCNAVSATTPTASLPPSSSSATTTLFFNPSTRYKNLAEFFEKDLYTEFLDVFLFLEKKKEKTTAEEQARDHGKNNRNDAEKMKTTSTSTGINPNRNCPAEKRFATMADWCRERSEACLL